MCPPFAKISTGAASSFATIDADANCLKFAIASRLSLVLADASVNTSRLAKTIASATKASASAENFASLTSCASSNIYGFGCAFVLIISFIIGDCIALNQIHVLRKIAPVSMAKT